MCYWSLIERIILHSIFQMNPIEKIHLRIYKNKWITSSNSTPLEITTMLVLQRNISSCKLFPFILTQLRQNILESALQISSSILSPPHDHLSWYLISRSLPVIHFHPYLSSLYILYLLRGTKISTLHLSFP